MSLTKKFSLLILSLVAIFSTAFIVSAQTLNLPELYVKDIILEKAEYKSGDIVSGSFILLNSKDLSVPDAYYEIMLVGNYQDNGLAGMVYDRSLRGPVHVAGQELKKIDFTYNLPAAIAGDNLGIQIGARTSAGIPLGWSDAFLKVTGGLSTLTVSSAIVNVDNKNFGLQNGPTIYEGKTGKLALTLVNNSLENISVVPKISIYNRTIGTSLLAEESLPVIETVTQTPAKNYNLNFTLPTFNYRAGVYAGRLDLVDAQGVKRAPSVDFRYIVAGDIFTIQNVSIDKEAVKKGEDIKLTVGFTGATYDITTLESTGAEEADLNIELFDQTGKSVASHTELINFNKVQSQIFTLKAEKEASALAVKITVSKDGKVLTTYNTALSADFSPKEEDLNLWQVALYVVLVIIIVIIFFLLLRKKNKNIITPIAGAMILFGIFGLTNFTQAYTIVSDTTESGKFSPTITMSVPTENQEVTAGARFHARGNVLTSFCTNDPQQVRITATLRGTSQTYSHYYDYSYSTGGYVTCTNPNDGDTCSQNWTSQFSLGDGSTQYFTASATNGTYYIDLKVEAYHNGVIYSTKIVAQPFKVISPKNLTAACPAPGNLATLSWIGGAGSASYVLGVNNNSNDWKGDCSVTQFPGDQCVTNQPTNSYSFASIPGATYSWWVHSRAGNGTVGSPSGGTNFTCVINNPILNNPTPACGATTASLSWNLNGRTTSGVRLNDRTNSTTFEYTTASCASGTYINGDLCKDSPTGNSYNVNVVSGHTYEWWLWMSDTNSSSEKKTFSVAACSCGNGTIEGSEACDAGTNNGACPDKACSSSCTVNNCDDDGGGDDNGGGNDDEDDIIIIDKEEYIPDPNLNCTVSMTNPPTGPVNVNTRTTWAAESGFDCPDCTKIWTLIDAVNPSGKVITATTSSSINNIFTTIGQKTIGAQFISGNMAGRMCTSTMVSVVQTGGNIQEQ
jgi:hypothetical protein